MNWASSPSTADSIRNIGHVETARSLPEPLELERLLELYGVPERSEFAPQVWAVISGAALRLQVGGPGVLKAQLGHLPERREAPNAEMQVLPAPADLPRRVDPLAGPRRRAGRLPRLGRADYEGLVIYMEFQWRKSSHSQARNGCVEIGSTPTAVGVRDSELGDDSPVPAFSPKAFSASSALLAAR